MATQIRLQAPEDRFDGAFVATLDYDAAGDVFCASVQIQQDLHRHRGHPLRTGWLTFTGRSLDELRANFLETLEAHAELTPPA